MLRAFRNFAAFYLFMKVSAKNIIILTALVPALSSCGKEEQQLSPAQISAKADSIVQSRMEKLRRQAKEDLDKRLPIELKPKIDSLRQTGNAIDQVPVFPDEPNATDTGDDDATDNALPLKARDTLKK